MLVPWPSEERATNHSDADSRFFCEYQGWPIYGKEIVDLSIKAVESF